eukprot:scaffold12244_cov216-Isochrysis_galbana.AAC.6
MFPGMASCQGERDGLYASSFPHAAPQGPICVPRNCLLFARRRAPSQQALHVQCSVVSMHASSHDDVMDHGLLLFMRFVLHNVENQSRRVFKSSSKKIHVRSFINAHALSC